MHNQRLREILPPPKKQQERPSEKDWRLVEDKWCILPTDFKEFITEYGTGSIENFIWLFNPASHNPNLNLAEQISRQLEALRDAIPAGLRMFPEEGGILPFGISDNGDLLAWKAQGEPDSWHVVVVDSRAPLYEEFDFGFSQFLVGILTKEITCRIFPKDVPSDNPTVVQRTSE